MLTFEQLPVGFFHTIRFHCPQKPRHRLSMQSFLAISMSIFTFFNLI